MKANGTSESYQNQNPKAMRNYCSCQLSGSINFFDVKVTTDNSLLDTKIHNSNINSDKRWITSWNDYSVTDVVVL
jgi:hypothetical protein